MRKKFKKVMASLLALTLAITPIAIPKEVKAESNMPSAVDLSTSPYFPEIENQQNKRPDDRAAHKPGHQKRDKQRQQRILCSKHRYH